MLENWWNSLDWAKKQNIKHTIGAILFLCLLSMLGFLTYTAYHYQEDNKEYEMLKRVQEIVKQECRDGKVILKEKGTK